MAKEPTPIGRPSRVEPQLPMPQIRTPRLCLDMFESNVDDFIGKLTVRIAKAKGLLVGTNKNGDYRHTLNRYIALLESAKIAATAHRDIVIRDDAALNE